MVIQVFPKIGKTRFSRIYVKYALQLAVIKDTLGGYFYYTGGESNLGRQDGMENLVRNQLDHPESQNSECNGLMILSF